MGELTKVRNGGKSHFPTILTLDVGDVAQVQINKNSYIFLTCAPVSKEEREETMIRNKIFLIFAAILLLNFGLNNSSFAQDYKEVKTCCPDYACEFCGKDTCEGFNRKIFIFNSKVNKYVIKPVNIVWASIMPKYGMDRVQCFYTNLEFPIRYVSCILQKDFKASKKEAVRFLTNTTLGVGGLYDTALTKFKIEPCQEDIEQVLAHYNVKKGPYVVLPIVAQGNVRDIVGQVLDYPLNPSSYIIGPAVAIAKAVSLVNKTAYMQPIAKTINSTYADPYDITKKLFGVEKYIKNNNLDRKEVLAEKTATQNVIKINNVAENPELKPDINMEGYNPQSPLVDSMRTALFEAEKMNDKRWSELSIWNKDFEKKIKTSSVNIDEKHPNYKYRYILQKNKTSPLAIIYPSFGEGILSHHSVVLSKLLYDEGYSVIIQGSPFQWEFVKSMPDTYKPGFPTPDTYYSRLLTLKILNTIESQKGYKFDKKILIGTSFGALTTLFTAAKEEQENTLGISKYISINPPVEILFALKQVDDFSQDWKKDQSDIKMRMAIAAEKIIQIAQAKDKPEALPFTDDEAKLVIGFVMQQKLSDLIFTIENTSKSKKSNFYQTASDLSFKDYAKKYLLIDDYKSAEKLSYDTSLYSISDFLNNNTNYKIYHTVDDYYVNPEQLVWLKKQTNNKSVYFNNGSHLGELYRKEFIDEFKKDIALGKPTVETAVPEQTKLETTAPEHGL